MKLFRREAEFEHRDAVKEEAAAAHRDAYTKALGRMLTSQDHMGSQGQNAASVEGGEVQYVRTDRKVSRENKSGRAAEDAVYGRR